MSRETRLSLFLAVFALFGVCVVPLGASQTTEDQIWQPGEEGELMRWRIEEFNENNGGAASFSNNVTWLKFSSLEKAIPQSILFVEIRFTATIQSTGDGDWNYTFETNTNTTWEDCSWILPTRDPGVVGGSPVAYATFSVSCANTIDNFTEDNQFTWWINRTADSGNPDVPLAQHLSIRMDRGEFVVYPMDLNITNLETYLPIVLFLALVAWSLWNGWLLPALAATLGVIGSYMDIGVAEVGAMFLFLLFLWLQYYRDKVTMLQERGLK